jgi:hypothetical protein
LMMEMINRFRSGVLSQLKASHLLRYS